jgi:hypothetical protein
LRDKINFVEKNSIAKQVQQYDFPNKKLAEDSYSHDLEKRLGVAGLKQFLSQKEKVDIDFIFNWTVAKDWLKLFAESALENPDSHTSIVMM